MLQKEPSLVLGFLLNINFDNVILYDILENYMYYINEYFGPVFVVKQLPARIKITVTKKVYETCGNSSCKAYGNRELFDSFCPHCGSRCSTFDIEKKRNLFISDVSKELDNILVYPFNDIPEGDLIFIPKFSNDGWLTPLTKQHIIFKSLTRKCQNQSCNNLDLDIQFDHTYCSGCGVKAECQVSVQYESNFTIETAKTFNIQSDKTSFIEFERPFNNDEANENLKNFKQLKKTQEIFEVIESIYGEESTSIQNRQVNFFDN